ncbi:hypothetical protein [Commensalibacter oyaizuii]|uniref:Uncharacterized protein n=1 Tax=Commensalibacter oyaizuii TaxID=3043873 RepID=A0ABT6Q1B6_9PROT|nr:hypothetical protein [Commensalibacter sp. TBRC 16381]MDI2090897.1 hypothetical protein [Commensalibacter sp. TBRC 16381]
MNNDFTVRKDVRKDHFGEDTSIKLAFTIQSNKKMYAILVGSGISRSSGIMTGWGTCDLIARYATAKEEMELDCESDEGRDNYWAEWYRTFQKRL